MDKVYADAVRLLLAATPEVFANDIFAMKGGTAINLFVRDMPRLSVDIDVVYTPWQVPREQALAAIADEIEAIAARLAKRGMRTRKVASKDLGETKLLIERDDNQRDSSNASMSCSPDRRNSRKSRPRHSHVSATLKSVRYSSTPFLDDEPAITSRSRANALMACSALLLFQGTPS